MLSRSLKPCQDGMLEGGSGEMKLNEPARQKLEMQTVFLALEGKTCKAVFLPTPTSKEKAF